MEFIRRGFHWLRQECFQVPVQKGVPNCRRGGVSRFGCALLVGAQLVWLVGEGIDECVGGGLDGCRLRIVDVVLGVHG